MSDWELCADARVRYIDNVHAMRGRNLLVVDGINLLHSVSSRNLLQPFGHRPFNQRVLRSLPRRPLFDNEREWRYRCGLHCVPQRHVV